MLAEKINLSVLDKETVIGMDKVWKDYELCMDGCNYVKTIELINNLVSERNRLVDKQELWKNRKASFLVDHLAYIKLIASMIEPFVPIITNKVLQNIQQKTYFYHKDMADYNFTKKHISYGVVYKESSCTLDIGISR